MQYISEEDELLVQMANYPTSRLTLARETGRYSPVVDHWLDSPNSEIEKIWNFQGRLENTSFNIRGPENGGPLNRETRMDDLVTIDNKQLISAENKNFDLLGFGNHLADFRNGIEADWLTSHHGSEKFYERKDLPSRKEADGDLPERVKQNNYKLQDAITQLQLSGFEGLIKLWDVDAWKLINNV